MAVSTSLSTCRASVSRCVAGSSDGGGLSLARRAALSSEGPRSRVVRSPTNQSTSREDTMGSKTDQIKGLANQAAGKVKQGVGKNHWLQGDAGKRRGARGQGQSATDNGKGQVIRQRHGQQGSRQGQQEALSLECIRSGTSAYRFRSTRIFAAWLEVADLIGMIDQPSQETLRGERLSQGRHPLATAIESPAGV